MTRPVRVSAVSFLNARPLVHGLDRHHDLFDVQFDLPSVCARRLHAGEVDLGLIPAIEYLHGDYRLVPDIAIGSDGAIRSVAIFTRQPIGRVRTLAVDTSSRTSVALARVLCVHYWHIAPDFVPMAPALADMLAAADAALVIGDPALEIDARACDVEKLDLGLAWQDLTGLPFVYAAWAGRPGTLGPAHLAALRDTRDAGVAAMAAIAHDYAPADPVREAMAVAYLRDNLSYAFGERERAGLERFWALAVEVGHAPHALPVRYFP